MAETRVSATDFRVHLKDIANRVAGGGEAFVVERHGFPMGVFVGCEEYAEFCRWRSMQKKETAKTPPLARARPDELSSEQNQRSADAFGGDGTDGGKVAAVWKPYPPPPPRAPAFHDPPS